jgi:LysR family transcriptional regulator, hydrogen peroxide-inducible genes activator
MGRTSLCLDAGTVNRDAMEIHQLRYFCAVARTGSFTRAAEEEGISQPSLSQQIVKLERNLNSKLFDRLGRRVQLTECGEALLPQAHAILRQMNDARSTLDSLRNGVRGRLKIGSIPTITPYFLAPRLAEFVKLYPEVELRLSEDITPKLVQSIKEGELDVAIVGLPVRNPDIVCSELFREEIMVAVKKGHRLSREPRVKVAQLKQERMLLLKEGHCFRDDALTACRRGAAPFISVFETDQFSSIFSLIAGGFGISLVPEMATVGQAGCDFLPLEKNATRRVGYIRAQRHVASPAQRSFVEWLRKISKRTLQR